MAKGKKTCKILKEIRRQIAEANDIEYVVEECQYKGDCLGTCPKCEAEVRYLEQQLHQRQLLGKAVVLAGVSVGMFTLSSCNSNSKTMGETTNDTTKVFYDIENGTMGISEPIDVYEYPKIKIEKLSNSESLKIKVEGEIKNGCTPIVSENYLFDKIRSLDKKGNNSSNSENNVEIYEIVEEMPSFNGGMDALVKFFEANLKCPQNVDKESSNGEVICNFIINEDGSISDIRVKKKKQLHPLWDAEVVRVISTMPKWNPGKHDGKPVKVEFSLPFSIHLQ